MVDPSQIAAMLASAQRDRRPLSPVTDEHPELDEAAAYDVQWAGVEGRLAAGETLVGARLAVTSRIEQQARKVGAPVYGWVTGAMLLTYGEPVELTRFIRPRVAPGIAFLLGRDVTTPATVTSVLAATEVVFAAVDVLDSRYDDNARTRLPDLVADNAGAGALVLGPSAVPPAAVEDLRLLGCVLRVNGDVVATAAGAAAMGHPAASVAWLANRLAARPQTLRAGMLVYSGALTEPVPLELRAAATVELEGLGSIEVYGQ